MSNVTVLKFRGANAGEAMAHVVECDAEGRWGDLVRTVLEYRDVLGRGDTEVGDEDTIVIDHDNPDHVFAAAFFIGGVIDGYKRRGQRPPRWVLKYKLKQPAWLGGYYTETFATWENTPAPWRAMNIKVDPRDVTTT